VILGSDDKLGARWLAESAPGDVDAEGIDQDASRRVAFATSELISAPTESTAAPGAWYDVEEGRYVEEPAQRHGSHEQRGVQATPAQAQPQIHPQSSRRLRDQIGPQRVDEIAESTPGKSTLRSLPKSSNSGDNGWTDENIAELEKELGLALDEQRVESSSASTPASPSLRSAEAAQDDIQNQQQSRDSGGRPEEPQDASRRGAPALELSEQQETDVQRSATTSIIA
jgi:hypothetical protein